MKPYILITGNLNNIDEFENKVSSALEDGYDICHSMVMKNFTDPDTGSHSILLAQSMILDDSDEFDEDDDYETIEFDEDALFEDED